MEQLIRSSLSGSAAPLMLLLLLHILLLRLRLLLGCYLLLYTTIVRCMRASSAVLAEVSVVFIAHAHVY